MNKLKRFCAYTPLKVLAICLILSLTLCVFLYIRMNSLPHREGLAVLALYLLVAYSILCPILSYSILLNLYKAVRENIILSFLSFYFPIVISLAALLFAYASHGGEVYMIMIWIIYMMPFIIPQTYYFIRFRKLLKQGIFATNNYPDE